MNRLVVAVCGAVGLLLVALLGSRVRLAGSLSFPNIQLAEAAHASSPTESKNTEAPSDRAIAQDLLDYCAEIVEALPDPPFSYSEKTNIRTSSSPLTWFPNTPIDCKRKFYYDGKAAYASLGIDYSFDARRFKQFAVAVMPAYEERLGLTRWHRHCSTIPNVNVDLTNILELLTEAAKYTLIQPTADRQVLLHVYLNQSELGLVVNVYPPGTAIPPEAFKLEGCSS